MADTIRIEKLNEQTGETRYVRESFDDAGQHSYDLPPTEHQEMFEELTNVMPVWQGVLQKRWGYGLWNNAAATFRRAYEYQNDTTGDRRILFSNTSLIRSLNEDGTSHNATVLSLGGSPVESPRIVSSRSFAYFADGDTAGTNAKKWNGAASGGTSKWGIGAPTITSAASGPNNPGTVSQGVTAFKDWTVTGTLLTDIQSSNNVYARVVGFTGADISSEELTISNFGFALTPGVTILGIKFEIERSTTNTAGSAGALVQHYIMKNGAAGGGLVGVDLKEETIVGNTAEAYVTFGSSTDLWGNTWGAADINAANFGLLMQLDNGGTGSFDYNLDHVRCTVYYSGPITHAYAAGNVTLVAGRKYYTIYKNSSTGHVSGLSLPSASTGPQTARVINLANIPVSTDSQVDKKLVLATADGGDETILYELIELLNATTTYADNVTEAEILTRNIYLEIDEFGNEVGAADNDPPTNGIRFPTKHTGRIYGASGQILYFSKNLSELATSTGLITGKYEEAWPADYQLDISEGAEEIRGLLSGGDVLYIATERRIRRLFGTGPLDFSKPEVIFTDVGVLNQDVWKAVYREGNPAGVMWLTPDFRVMLSDMNTYIDAGAPIQDLLDTINSAQAESKAHAAILNDGGYDLYILAVPTGSNTECDTLLVCNLRTQSWFVWKPTDKSTALLYNVNASGVPQLIMAGDNSKIYKYAVTNTQDRVSDTPVSFTATIISPWLNLGDGGVRKVLNKMEILGADAAMTVTIQGASSQAEFTTPATVVSAGALVTDQLGHLFLRLAGKTTKDRWYRYTLSSAANTSDPIVAGLSFDYFGIHRW